MTCHRCHGRLLREHLYRRGAWWWRCFSCGERIDSVILRNRAEQEAELADHRCAQKRDLKEWAAWFARLPAAGVTTRSAELS